MWGWFWLPRLWGRLGGFKSGLWKLTNGSFYFCGVDMCKALMCFSNFFRGDKTTYCFLPLSYCPLKIYQKAQKTFLMPGLVEERFFYDRSSWMQAWGFLAFSRRWGQPLRLPCKHELSPSCRGGQVAHLLRIELRPLKCSNTPSTEC